MLGGFDAEYAGLEELAAAMLTHATLTSEFAACVDQVVVLINLEKIKARLRGGKRADIIKLMISERSKVVETVQKEGIETETPYRAIGTDL